MDSSADPSTSDVILRSVKIEVTVALGKARIPMNELSQMSVDSVFMLDCNIEDPVTLFVGNKRVAEGVLEEAEGADQGAIAVRIKQIFDENS